MSDRDKAALTIFGALSVVFVLMYKRPPESTKFDDFSNHELIVTLTSADGGNIVQAIFDIDEVLDKDDTSRASVANQIRQLAERL